MCWLSVGTAFLLLLLPLGATTALDLSGMPRRVYTPTRTPIEPMPSLSEALGDRVKLWIKRDDQLGLTAGGNKVRKLEFVMADALAKGADTIVTCGAVQSNHCRLTLSACVREKIKCSLILEERVVGSFDPKASGNNYLFNLLGCENAIPCKAGETQEAMDKLEAELTAKGRKVYQVPGGASNEIGATGYVACAQEILYQMYEDQLPQFEYLVTASGSGGTHSGLVAGVNALRSPMKVLGVSTRANKADQEEKILDLARKTSKYCGVKEEVPAEAVQVYDQYVGPGYSLPTEGMEEAVTLFARNEGILLDPVYSGKAAAGLIDLVRQGYFDDAENVLFLHTGGAPSLYHYLPIDEKVQGPAGAGET